MSNFGNMVAIRLGSLIPYSLATTRMGQGRNIQGLLNMSWKSLENNFRTFCPLLHSDWPPPCFLVSFSFAIVCFPGNVASLIESFPAFVGHARIQASLAIYLARSPKVFRWVRHRALVLLNCREFEVHCFVLPFWFVEDWNPFKGGSISSVTKIQATSTKQQTTFIWGQDLLKEGLKIRLEALWFGGARDEACKEDKLLWRARRWVQIPEFDCYWPHHVFPLLETLNTVKSKREHQGTSEVVQEVRLRQKWLRELTSPEAWQTSGASSHNLLSHLLHRQVKAGSLFQKLNLEVQGDIVELFSWRNCASDSSKSKFPAVLACIFSSICIALLIHMIK